MAHEDKASRVRKLAGNKDTNWAFWDHAFKEMAKDSIFPLSVKSMLKRCSVERVDIINFQERIRAVGRDVDENRIVAVVILEEDTITVHVVTAWSSG